MLEVINGFLMIYFIVLCFLSDLVPYLVKPITACFTRPSNEERSIFAELVKLKAEQQAISMKDEFAAFSRLQRKINKLENQLRDDSQTRISKSLALKGSIRIALQVVIGLLIFVSVIWFRREPIVALKGNLFPLSTILSYPSGMPNGISTHVWVLISNVSLKCLLPKTKA